MNLESVIEELETVLDTVAGLRIAVVGEKPVPPAAFVSYPERIEFDGTYKRGMDSLTLQAVVLVGRTVDRATRKALAAYCAGSGASSIKAVLEAHTYTSCDSVTVTSCDFQVEALAGIDHMAAIFTVSIVGSGA